MREARGGGTEQVRVSPRWTSLFAAGLAVLAADQATKAIIRSTLAPGQGIDISGPLSIQHLQNPGIAGGGLAGNAVVLALVATAAVVGILGFLAYHGAARPIVLIGFGLLIGGGLSNLLDRLWLGYVTDFLLRSNEVFNLADVAIFLGGVLVLAALVALIPQALSRYQPRSGG